VRVTAVGWPVHCVEVEAEQFDSATVFFSDIADFHDISVNSFPIDIIHSRRLYCRLVYTWPDVIHSHVACTAV